MRLIPLLPLLLLVAACDDDDDEPLGLMVEIGDHDRKFDKKDKFPKRVAIVRGTVVSATGIPVLGAHVKITAFFIDFKPQHSFDDDRCKNTLVHTSTSTGVSGEFLADLRVDAAVPELCIVVSVTPPTLSGLRPSVVKVENVLPALNTGLAPIPTVLVNVILVP